MSPLESLARGLPRDSELGGNLWPADSDVDGAVNDRVKLCFGLVSGGPSALEPVENAWLGSP